MRGYNRWARDSMVWMGRMGFSCRRDSKFLFVCLTGVSLLEGRIHRMERQGSGCVERIVVLAGCRWKEVLLFSNHLKTSGKVKVMHSRFFTGLCRIWQIHETASLRPLWENGNNIIGVPAVLPELYFQAALHCNGQGWWWDWSRGLFDVLWDFGMQFTCVMYGNMVFAH